MQYNNEKATESPEADMIERNIESHLDRLSSLISEVQYRIKKLPEPKKILSHPWFKISVLIYLALLLFVIIGKLLKNLQKYLQALLKNIFKPVCKK